MKPAPSVACGSTHPNVKYLPKTILKVRNIETLHTLSFASFDPQGLAQVAQSSHLPISFLRIPSLKARKLGSYYRGRPQPLPSLCHPIFLTKTSCHIKTSNILLAGSWDLELLCNLPAIGLIFLSPANKRDDKYSQKPTCKRLLSPKA